MTSITKIIILITAIIANSGYALDISDDDINQPGAQVYDTPSNVKRDPSPYPTRYCDDISGCVTTDKSLDYPISRDYYEMIGPMDPISFDHKFAISKLPGLRERRQVVVKTKSSDDGPNSVMSLLARSMIRNRNRRSIPETSSIKNPTVEEHTQVVSNRPARMSKTKRFLILLLTTLTMPYFVITPSHDYDYEDSSEVYTS